MDIYNFLLAVDIHKVDSQISKLIGQNSVFDKLFTISHTAIVIRENIGYGDSDVNTPQNGVIQKCSKTSFILKKASKSPK